MGRRKPPFFFYFYCRARQRGGFLAGPVVRGPGVDWQRPASLVGFDPTLLSCAKKRGVEPPRRNCPEETLGKGFLWTPSETEGRGPSGTPGRPGTAGCTNRTCLRTFECSIAGGTTNLADPTRRKANFLWKFLCAGASPSAMRAPSPIAARPQGFLQSKNALRRTNATKFAARQKDR